MPSFKPLSVISGSAKQNGRDQTPSPTITYTIDDLQDGRKAGEEGGQTIFNWIKVLAPALTRKFIPLQFCIPVYRKRTPHRTALKTNKTNIMQISEFPLFPYYTPTRGLPCLQSKLLVLSFSHPCGGWLRSRNSLHKRRSRDGDFYPRRCVSQRKERLGKVIRQK